MALAFEPLVTSVNLKMTSANNQRLNSLASSNSNDSDDQMDLLEEDDEISKALGTVNDKVSIPYRGATTDFGAWCEK